MSNKNRRARRPVGRITERLAWLLSIAALAAVPAWVAPAARAEDGDETRSAERIARGRISFRLYCRSCHGEHAKGGGPVAHMLKVPPPDLTRITARHGGEFPEEKVRRIIDGRDEVTSHGSRDMPIWADAFRVVEESEDEAMVQEKITRLVYYLRSIQEE